MSKILFANSVLWGARTASSHSKHIKIKPSAHSKFYSLRIKSSVSFSASLSTCGCHLREKQCFYFFSFFPCPLSFLQLSANLLEIGAGKVRLVGLDDAAA